MSKHRISFGFNDPPEAMTCQATIHFCGPETEQIIMKANGFRELLGGDLKEKLGASYMNQYFEIKIPMKDDSSYKPHLKAIEAQFAPGGPLDTDRKSVV